MPKHKMLTEEEFEALFIEWQQFIENNPIKKQVFVGKDGRQTKCQRGIAEHHGKLALPIAHLLAPQNGSPLQQRRRTQTGHLRLPLRLED